jgi:4-amino-4-deoxy-L-arabinose transferase-like glycosyltransferase
MIAPSRTLPDHEQRESPGRSVGSSKVIWLVIFCLALALRLFSLGKQNLWSDESSTLPVSKLALRPMLDSLAFVHSNKPPLYFLLMHYWLPWGTSEFWIRLPSAIPGALTCLIALVLGEHLLGKKRGWFMGLALAVAPFHVYYSQEARMYALLVMFGAMAMLCTYLLAKTQQWLYALLYLVSATLSCYTFTYGVFLILFSCIFSLCFQPRLPRRVMVITWVTNLLVAGLFCPWVPRLMTTVKTGRGLHTLVRGSVSDALAYSFFSLGLGTTFGPTPEQLRALGRRIFVEQPVAGGLLVGGLLAVGLVTVIGMRLLWHRNRNGFSFALVGLGVFLGCPAAANLLRPSIPNNPRYAILAIIPLSLVFAAFAIWTLGEVIWKKACAFLFVGCIGVSLANNYFNPRYARDDIRSAARFLLSLETAPRTIFVCAEFVAPTLRYYYDGPARIMPLDVVGVSVEEALKPFAEELAEGRIVALVYTRPDHGDPQGILPTWFKQSYQLQLEKAWTGVALYVFDTRRHATQHSARLVQLLHGPGPEWSLNILQQNELSADCNYSN